MDQVKKYFKDTLTKHGVALTISQLLEYAKSKKINVSKKALGDFIYNQASLAKYSPAKQPRIFQTIGVLRDGVYFIDYGEFHKNWAVINGQMSGFLVAVENLTNKLFVSPCGNKNSASWFKAIDKFVELTRNVHIIFSDRDAVATSQTFRDAIMQKYGIKWYFLKKGNKSYLAERYIGFMKTKLSQAIESKGVKRWVDYVDPIVKFYNAQKIEGTPYKRQAINKNNFNDFVAKLLKVEDPSMLYAGAKVSSFKNEAWNKAIFKFRLGQKVLLARKANWKNFDGEKASGAFFKASMQGGFTDKRFTVSGRQLRRTKGFKNFVTVYSLEEMGPSMHFYERELKSVNEN